MDIHVHYLEKKILKFKLATDFPFISENSYTTRLIFPREWLPHYYIPNMSRRIC